MANPREGVYLALGASNVPTTQQGDHQVEGSHSSCFLGQIMGRQFPSVLFVCLLPFPFPCHCSPAVVLMDMQTPTHSLYPPLLCQKGYCGSQLYWPTPSLPSVTGFLLVCSPVHPTSRCTDDWIFGYPDMLCRGFLLFFFSYRCLTSCKSKGE